MPGTSAKKVQFAAATEHIEGVAQPISASHLLPVDVGVNANPETELIETDQARGTLTKPLGVAGSRSSTVESVIDLMGNAAGSPTTPPPYDRLLRAAGFRRRAAKRLLVGGGGAWTGANALPHGTTVTFEDGGGTGSGATRQIIGIYRKGATSWVFYDESTGSGSPASGDTLIEWAGGASSLAISGAGDAATDAFAYFPNDDPLSIIDFVSANDGTGTLTTGEELLGASSGARAIYRGTATIASGAGAVSDLLIEIVPGSVAFTNGEVVGSVTGTWAGTLATPPRQEQQDNPSLTCKSYHKGLIKTAIGVRGNITFRLPNRNRGKVEFTGRGGAQQPVQGDNLVFPAANLGAQAPLVNGSIITVYDIDDPANLSSTLPCFQELVLETGNEVGLRECPNHPSGSGYESAVIGDRSPSGSINPEAIAESIFAWWGKAWTKVPFRVHAVIGAQGGDGNTHEFIADQVQAGEIGEGERENIRVSEVPLSLRGTVDDELFVFVW